MTGFELLPGWFEVPLDGQTRRWARDTAKRALDTVGEPYTRSDTKRLRESLTTMATHAVQHQPAQAFLYCPDPSFGPRLLVEVVVLPAPDELTPERLAGWLGADKGMRFRPDEIDSFTARAGEGLHATQRWVDDQSHVYETWFYCWRPDGYDVLVIASTTFADLTLAGLAQPDVDEFMATFDVEGPAQPGSHA